MTANQTPTYRPAPVTQRDGSALANSNCRMASIATGLDYHTTGSKKSTGAKMRSYTTDQSGGTDSADAAQSWANGYSQTLTIRDGYTFDNALDDLRKGSLVHLDVWHATVGGPCLSGSGAYGHTIAVLPDCSGGSWLVADPWCSPPKWARVTESKLRAGAEEWGRRVYGAATHEADWTAGPFPDPTRPDDIRWAILRRVIRALMDRYHAGGDDDPTPDPGDTGGGKAILYTRTRTQPLAGGGSTPMGVQLTFPEPFDGTAVTKVAGAYWIRVWDSHFGGPLAVGFTKRVFARAKLDAPLTSPGGTATFPVGTPVVLIGDDVAILLEKDVTLTAAPSSTDEDWVAWVLKGSPADPHA